MITLSDYWGLPFINLTLEENNVVLRLFLF